MQTSPTSRLHALYSAPRIRIGSAFVYALIVSFGFGAVSLPLLGSKITFIGLALLGAVAVYGSAVSSSRVVFHDQDARTICIEWRRPFLGVRRHVYPVSRFRSVVSFYPWGRNSRNWICLMDHTGIAGLHLASFDLNYKYRSFWDLFPKIIEAEGARELRTKLVSALALADQGFVGLRDHPKGIK